MSEKPSYEELERRVGELEAADAGRRRALAALQESEGRLRSLIDALPDLVWLKDTDGVYLACNSRMESFFGAKQEEIVGQTDYDFMTKALADFFRSHDQEAIAKGGPSVNEEEITFADDGHQEILETIKTPMYSTDGRVLGVLGIGRDITDRKRAQEEQAETQRQLVERTQFIEMILNYLPIGLGVNYIDTGEITYLNRKFEEIYGWPKAEFSNVADFFDRVYPDPREREVVREKIMNDIASGVPERMAWENMEVVTKTGERRIVNAKNIPIPDQNLMISTVQDFTEKRRLEEQIRQAHKMEAVGRLAGGVAHDFNNMLSLIIGHADMALRDPDLDRAPMLHEALVEIRNAGERSADLTRQLLAFARKQTVAPKVLDLNRTIEGMTKMLQRLIGEDVDLSWLPGENVWPVKMDPSQVDQILANLCVNARDAIADVGEITIETANTEFDETYCADHPGLHPGEYVLLAVSDSGCGMDTQTLSRIFEPFFTTKESRRGTGLGLATVYGVVTQNSGFVNVHSEPGQGTTFNVYFPRYRDSSESLSDKERERSKEGGRETILLVEDEPAILKLTTRVLEGLGYRVVAAGSPGEAVRHAEEHFGEIHLLVTDVVMPEMNGRDLAQNIWAVHPEAKCLFMSGYTADVIAHHGVLDDGVNFIQKPFLRDALGAKVREVLDQDG